MDTAMPVVLSMTEFANFKRCRKLFDFATVRELTPHGGGSSDAMQRGSDFHAWMAAMARSKYGGEPYDVPRIVGDRADAEREMYEVSREYLLHRPLPDHIISAEEPIYTLILEATYDTPEVWVRTTLDLVYERNGTVVGRDYKTFAAAPSMDVDLDFQGGVYATILAKHWGDRNIEFEWEYVRSCIGRQLKAGWVEWPVEDRYFNISRVMNDVEYDTLWTDLQNTARDILDVLDNRRFTRTSLRSGPHGCDNCGYKALCKEEFSQGPLTQTAISLLAEPTDKAARQTRQSILTDPRVAYLIADGIVPLEEAVLRVYGVTGRSRGFTGWCAMIRGWRCLYKVVRFGRAFVCVYFISLKDFGVYGRATSGGTGLKLCCSPQKSFSETYGYGHRIRVGPFKLEVLERNPDA